MAGSNASKKVVFATLAGNALIAVTKFAASAVTGSSAMLSKSVPFHCSLMVLWNTLSLYE